MFSLLAHSPEVLPSALHVCTLINSGSLARPGIPAVRFGHVLLWYVWLLPQHVWRPISLFHVSPRAKTNIFYFFLVTFLAAFLAGFRFGLSLAASFSLSFSKASRVASPSVSGTGKLSAAASGMCESSSENI